MNEKNFSPVIRSRNKDDLVNKKRWWEGHHKKGAGYYAPNSKNGSRWRFGGLNNFSFKWKK